MRGARGHRLVLALDNSYVVDDGLAVSAYTDTVDQSDANAEVCMAALVEMLLRAPRRGCVRLLPPPLLCITDGVQVIWDLVHQLQLTRWCSCAKRRMQASMQHPPRQHHSCQQQMCCQACRTRGASECFQSLDNGVEVIDCATEA